MRLPLVTLLDMPQGMCPYIKEHSLGLPRRLGRLSLRHPGDALNLRLLLLRRSALKPPLLQAFYAPEAVARSPEGVFGGRSLSFICGPVGFRGVAPHHRPAYPEHLHRISAISHGDSSVRPSPHSPRRLDDLLGSSGRIPPDSDPSGIASVSSLHHDRSLLSVQGAVLRVDAKVFTRLMAPISAILHRYGIRMLRYLDDWLILESRTTCLQARDRLLQVCEELGLQVNFRKSSLIPSQDMTYLGMQIQSVRFFAKPTATRVENLLKIIEGFFSSLGPPAALWHRLLGHLSSLTLLVKGGILRMRSLQIRLRSRWDFRDELLRIPWDPLCQEDLLWWS